MESWNVAACRSHDGAELYLLNKSRTLVKVNKRLHFNPLPLLTRLESVRFPVKYTEGLDRIYFTVLTGDARGYYEDNKIWIDVSQNGIDEVLETFVHEVSHHMEDQENIAHGLHTERMKKQLKWKDKFSHKSDDEYMALGFEQFYSESLNTKKRLRKTNPVLYGTIRALHLEHRHG